MANTYILIASNTLGSSTASVTFSSIPSTYTDLVLRWSARSSGDTINCAIRLNSDTSNYSETYMYTNMISLYSGRQTGQNSYLPYGMNSSSYTANTFSSGEMYISNYNSTSVKQINTYGTSENNSSTSYMGTSAQRYAGSSITSVSISSYPYGGANNLVSGSSFYLYGIKSS